MNIIRIDHVSLNVADRARSIAWYGEALGMAASGAPGAVDEPVFLGRDGAQLGLFGDRPPGLRHIALASDPAGFAATADRLDALRVAYRLEHHTHHRSLYFADPDGHTIEIME
jgi:catechol 2,3-dioxygenase-like lactoylglutathione lyase family enzyme